MPPSCFALWQVGLRQGLGQITTKTHFFVVRHKSSDRLAVLQKHKSDVLIVSPINTIGKIACCLCNTHACFFHRIRLSDLLDYVKSSLTSLPIFSHQGNSPAICGRAEPKDCPPIRAASGLVYEVLIRMYPQKPPFELPRNYLLNHS